MSEQVAVRRPTSQEAPEIDGDRRAVSRPAGRRLLLLVLLACASVAVLGANSARSLAASLPDGRGYEQVTPSNKDDGDPYLRAGIFGGYQSDVGGDGFSYPSLYAFPGSQSDGIPYLALRGTSGWTNTNMIPPQSTDAGGLCAAYPSTDAWSPDMSTGILVDGQNQASGCGTDDPPLVPGTTAGGLPLCSATPLVTPCSGEQPGVQNIFVRDITNNTFQLVSTLQSAPPGITPADAVYNAGSSDLSHVVFSENAQLTSDAPSGDDLYEWVGGTVSLVTEVPATGTSCSGSACTPVVGSLAGGGMGSVLHAVSGDGSTIVFTANGNLYARQNGSSTVQLDAGIGGSGQFQVAAADGSKVFFTDSTGANLYEYNFSSGSPLTDLTPGGAAQIDGLSGAGDDGSLVYFVASSVLAANANGDGQTAQAAQPNLYVVNTATAGDSITFLATLAGGDSCDWTAGCLSARVSSNGAHVAFTSTNALTNYDNNGMPEIFVSDASAAGPGCVSCIPSGTAATSGAAIAGPELSGINSTTNYPERYISDSGQVFFNTSDALLPTATNGAQNVYEYEAGQLALISTGTSSADSFYLDSTPSGNDVFFATSSALVPQDIDGAYDIYDARVGGGFPVSTPAAPCQGESCQPPPSTPPATPVAGTVTFVGPGNPAPGHVTVKTIAKIKLLKRTVKGTKIALRVKVPASGQITVSGGNISKVSRSVSHAGTYTVTVHLSGKAKNRLKHKRKLKLALSVRYVPSAAGASTVKVKLTAKA